MKSLNLTFTIRAEPKDVWQALVDPHEIEGWGAGPANMNDRVGTEFKLWGGDIHGKNLEVIPQEKLVQEWFGGDWDGPTKVSITLTSEEDHCRVELFQENIPDEDFDSIKEGWNEYYFGPLKDYVEKGKDQYHEESL